MQQARQQPLAHVLVVEDDDLVRKLIGTVLQRKGYLVSFAGDAIAATQVARRELPDLVLLDILLPGGDGITVLERLRSIAMLQSVPVVVMTGADSEGYKVRAYQLGASEVLEKPVGPARLLEAVDSALSGVDAVGIMGLVGALESELGV